MKSLTDLAVPTNTQAVLLFAADPSGAAMDVLRSIVVSNSSHGGSTPMGNWGAEYFCRYVNQAVESGIINPDMDADEIKDSLRTVYEIAYEADWRRTAWWNSEEGRKWRARREQAPTQSAS